MFNWIVPPYMINEKNIIELIILYINEKIFEYLYAWN